MRNEAGGTLSVRYEVVQKESMSSSVQYVESSRWDFVHPVQSHVKGELVLVSPVHGIKLEGLRPIGTMSQEGELVLVCVVFISH